MRSVQGHKAHHLKQSVVEFDLRCLKSIWIYIYILIICGFEKCYMLGALLKNTNIFP